MPTNFNRIHAASIDVLLVERHDSFDTRSGYRLVHTIQASQERGLATPRRANDSGDLPVAERDGNIAHDLRAPEQGRQAGGLETDASGSGRTARSRSSGDRGLA